MVADALIRRAKLDKSQTKSRDFERKSCYAFLDLGHGHSEYTTNASRNPPRTPTRHMNEVDPWLDSSIVTNLSTYVQRLQDPNRNPNSPASSIAMQPSSPSIAVSNPPSNISQYSNPRPPAIPSTMSRKAQIRLQIPSHPSPKTFI
eukprot:GHVP01045523.1.p1 GENE.GHVP01045523.1~~GHVP01045523.1.p1  ORF type:complete len:146 (-),score=16.24 GHVP01045523.1:152-589(-)